MHNEHIRFENGTNGNKIKLPVRLKDWVAKLQCVCKNDVLKKKTQWLRKASIQYGDWGKGNNEPEWKYKTQYSIRIKNLSFFEL